MNGGTHFALTFRSGLDTSGPLLSGPPSPFHRRHFGAFGGAPSAFAARFPIALGNGCGPSEVIEFLFQRLDLFLNF